ncbi:ABC transporter permease, partial [uncultured Acetatifactor sp.]
DFRPEGGSIMGVLIKNEFYKLKREWFMVFLLLLSLLPIITGGAGAIFNSSTKSLADLFFFMNNQFSMFFPMVLFILIGSLFYQEYKNKTYINWITYGFSKKKLFLSKVTVSVVIGICFAAVLFIAFGLLVAILNGAGRLTGGISLFLKLAIGFGIEAGVVVFVTTCLGAIVINLSRNIIVTSVVGVIYGFVSCLFIGSERGFVIPGSFAYRVSMFFSDKSTYYEVPISATIGGCISIVLCFIVLFLVGLIVFSHKKKIEN